MLLQKRILLLAFLTTACNRPPSASIPSSTPVQTDFLTHTTSSTPTSLPTTSPLPLSPTHSPTPSSQSRISFPLSRPISPPGRDTVDPTYRFGSTQNDAREPHHGVELLNSSGTPVIASADGRVIFTGEDWDAIYSPIPNFYGLVVIVQHEIIGYVQPFFTLYAHLSEISVDEGESVILGQRVGLVGFSGAAVGSHLHFEVRMGENTYESVRNPELWLHPHTDVNSQPYGAIAGLILDKNGDILHLKNLVIERVSRNGQTIGIPIYLDTYAEPALIAQEPWGESFAVGDLPPGQYRISFVASGLQEHLTEVQPGEVTMVVFSN